MPPLAFPASGSRLWTLDTRLSGLLTLDSLADWAFGRCLGFVAWDFATGWGGGWGRRLGGGWGTSRRAPQTEVSAPQGRPPFADPLGFAYFDAGVLTTTSLPKLATTPGWVSPDLSLTYPNEICTACRRATGTIGLAASQSSRPCDSFAVRRRNFVANAPWNAIIAGKPTPRGLVERAAMR